jgi:cellulose synthase/poly-beta-1,6-N-acetylglucosamine synthase-like glycosyltransferase
LIAIIPIALLALTSTVLFVFGLNLLYLTVRAIRLAHPAAAQPPSQEWKGPLPFVCVQVPIYNERYVVERVLDAVCALDWPHDRFEVQALDDSDDDTTEIIAARLDHWRRQGIRVAHLRRRSRTGFKAGALAFGLNRTEAPFIAIFDADFVPPPDFLRRVMPSFANDDVGFAQARWGHLDETYSVFTHLQAMAIDFHFLVEQAVRCAAGYFTNFTGTAGVWRRVAIDESGGWSARTLTEDLDLSYRAQLRGWKAAYLEDVVVPEELPVSIDAYRRQQSRWATGSFQTAFRLLVPVLRSDVRAAVKFQAVMHLLAYGVGPVMLLQLSTLPILLLAHAPVGLRLPSFANALVLAVVFVGIAPWIGFVAAQTRRGRRWWAGIPALLCQVVGAGMSVNTLVALFRAFRPGGAFERTPKYRIVQAGQEWRDQAYVRASDPRVVMETVAGLGALATVPLALNSAEGGVAVYATLFAVGFLMVAALSTVEFFEILTLRRLGARALSRVRTAAPFAALLGLASILLLLAAQLAEPFEDGYGHWLIAANLASTGRMSDPLFGMQDTWLPGYQVLAAAVLHVFGLWHIDLLKIMSAIFGIATAACVYALAPNARQARIAVALLVLNPVFLFTSGSAVVEPMLTALLMGAALAATRERMKLAALLAALACLTSTKAWIWVIAAAALALVEVARSHAGVMARARTVAWTVPAFSALLFLQVGFAPATHSLARGTQEAVSASARGSVPADALARVAELATTYGLAALPLVLFAGVGLVVAVRRSHPTALWRFVYTPSAVYLAAVFALVGAGAYTGSHRYLYPALPAAALLAAAALDRYVPAIRLTAIASSAALAVAFVPVFMSFGADNAGLVAAGRATANSPGTLLTDSPVAAYYSGIAPTRIAGSQSLPPDRAQAMRWMQDHRVTAVVVEDISYYRAATVFPDLAAGDATLPFLSLGDQSSYQVSGGKPVHVYRLWPQLSLALTAEGKTAPLAKGMTLGAGTGEGMGFGAPIVRYADGWVYSRTSTTVQVGRASWTRTFALDEMGGDSAHSYAFVPIASRGEIAVTYTLDANGVAIAVNPVWLAPGYTQVGVLNEQSAAFDDFAGAGQPTRVGTAFSNWFAVSGGWARLRSGSLGVEWSVGRVPGATLYAGRELVLPDFDWAGLDYMFNGPFNGTTYRINVQEAR